jgi:hypothetical protein
MADLALNALTRKHAALAGELERHQATVRQLQIDLANVDATIRLFSPDTDLAKIKSKRLPPQMGAGKGEIAFIIFGLLRTAQRPCVSKELAQHVMIERNMDTTNAWLVNMVEERVASSLRRYRKLGLIRSIKKAGEYIRWEITPQDDAASSR